MTLDPVEEDRAAEFRRAQAGLERNNRARARALAGSQAARVSFRQRWWPWIMPSAPVVEPQDSDRFN